MITVEVKISSSLEIDNSQFNLEIDENSTVLKLFQILAEREMQEYLTDWEQTDLPPQLLIVVNGFNVRFGKGKDTLLNSGDLIYILPIAVGG